MMSVLGIREVRHVDVQKPEPALLLSAVSAPPVPEHSVAPANPRDPALCELLAELLPSAGFFVHFCLIDADGRTIADATKPEHGAGDLERLQASMRAFGRSYPRAGLSRAFLQDAIGTVALVTLPREFQFLAVADRTAPLGSVSMSVGKLAARLPQYLEEAGKPAGDPSAGG